MKLIIQIPCYNEEHTLPLTFKDLPRSIPGVDSIEVQIIDDGSSDNTLSVAKGLGARHIVSFAKHRGLAEAFKAGVDNALISGADILVNTDGDNQYCGKDIARLVEPIIKHRAEVVVGCRPLDKHPDFNFLKKSLQKMGSGVLRKFSNTKVKDAASGFRAYSRNALLQMNIYSRFSYCIETLIQAGYRNLKIDCVDVNVNPKTRESRLFKNIFQYLWQQGKTMVTIFLLYRANVLFNTLALIVLSLSLFCFFRYLVLVKLFNAPAGAFWPSIIVGGALFVIGIQIFFIGIVASLVSSVRKLGEDINCRIKKLEMRER